MNWPTTDDGRILVLRTNAPDGKSHGGFQWPHEVGATVTAPDWKPGAEIACGNGLHGLLWGCGAAGLLHEAWSPDTVWIVVAVDPADIATTLDGRPDKVRFRSCEVVHVGDRVSAPAFIADATDATLPIVYGTATAGYGGAATAGDGGTATAGYGGTATAGYGGTATAGYGGTATAGCGGVISVLFYDVAAQRYRRKIGEVDGATLKANTPYRVVDGEWVEAP